MSNKSFTLKKTFTEGVDIANWKNNQALEKQYINVTIMKAIPFEEHFRTNRSQRPTSARLLFNSNVSY